MDNFGSCTRLTAHCERGWKAVCNTIRSQRWLLLGTAGAWFILDIVFYANGLFSGQVTRLMGISADPRGEALASLILQLIALPGYLCTVLFIDQMGMMSLQQVGFVATALCFVFLAAWQGYLVQVPAVYIAVYGLTFFFQNFGANATTYIIPSIVFPTEQRATCHGISAAAGKLGAILGAQLFLSLTDSYCDEDHCTDDATETQRNAGLQTTFLVCGILSMMG